MFKRWLLGGGMAVFVLTVFQCIVAARQTPGSAVPEEIRVSDVIIRGTQGRSVEQIKVRLRTQPGRKFDSSALDGDVRDLYKTEQFCKILIHVQEDGAGRVKVFLILVALPNIVQKVTFLGAKHIKEEDLLMIAGVRPGMFISPDLNRQGCQRIVEEYAEMGRPFTRCTLVKGGELDDTEVVYEITEGPKLKVRDIQFVGNSLIKSERLTEMMRSSPKWFHRIGRTYSREMGQSDRIELIKYIRAEGYPDVRVSLKSQRSSDGLGVTLIFHIKEGTRQQERKSGGEPSSH